ncbi:MAG: ribosome-associated translation inhibitor RaiA [Candidatus Taylorbacteria bacterium]|nr:ribosome-associated translation inhibitor RaiA [Candidatus Taylorbacteria bacterium]
MNIIINGSHIQITDAIREYVTKKLQALDVFVDDTSKVVADLGKTTNHHKSGDIFRAEIHVHSHGVMTRVAKEAEDLYAAIDIAQGEMVDVLSAKKDKKQTLWRKGSQRIKAFAHGLVPKKWRR